VYDAVGNVMEAAQTTGAKYLKDLKLATISSAGLDASNTFIDVTFSEGIYGNNSQSAPLDAADLQRIFSQNGDNVTGVAISSVKQNDNTVEGSASALVGGESVVRVFLTVTNPPSTGLGTIEIKPADGSSIFDSGGNATLATETSGAKTLVSTQGPQISSGLITLDNSFTIITFNEAVYNTNGGAGALESSDFGITFTQNTGTATACTISGVSKQDGTALAGGETVVRVNLNVTGTTNSAETINIKPADGSSIYNAAGNPALVTETTGDLNLIDPGFEGYASADYSSWSEVGTASAVDEDAVIFRNGAKSVRCENPTTSYARGMKSVQIPILENQSYTYSAWCYLNDEGGAATDQLVSFRVEYSTGTGASSQTGVAFSSLTTWEEFTWSKTSPAGATWVQVSIRVKESVGSDQDVNIDDVTITKD